MAMVRFATTCDRCGKRSEEYTAWPGCRECGQDICGDCTEPGTLIEAELDTPARCLCRACASNQEGDPQ